MLRFIADASGATGNDIVLEVGTGPGFLTQHLAERAGAVWSVEIDRALFEVASKMLSHLDNVHVIQGDILAGKSKVDPAILNRVPDPPTQDGSLIHVSNLPYSTAVPILLGLLEGEPRIRRQVVTVQKELADRLLAGPGSRTYGITSVLIHLQAEVELLKSLQRNVFWPVPEVRSTVVKITRREGDIEGYGEFKGFLRGLFSQRRKSLLRGICSNPSHPAAEPVAREALAAVDVAPDCRVETLEPERILSLWRALGKGGRAAPGVS